MTEPRISKTRRRIAWEAACLLLYRRESEIYRAKLVAGKRICGGWVPRRELPTNLEVQTELARLSEPGACLVEPEFDNELVLDDRSILQTLPEKTQRLLDLEQLLNGDDSSADRLDCIDRWQYFASLLRPLENIRMPAPFHHTSDALFHSLQVFENLCQVQPYDEELLLAALLHESGRAVDARDPVSATLELLADDISDRTAWLIEQLPEANKIHFGTIGHRSLRRLRENESYEDLLQLAECDRLGNAAQANVRQLEDALDYIASLAEL